MTNSIPRKILTTILLSSITTMGVEWEELYPGFQYSRAHLATQHALSDYPFHILRINPTNYSFHLVSRKTKGQNLKTIDEWCESEGFIAAVNAGMFQLDYVSNIGYMRMAGILNNSHKNAYQSVFVTDPLKPGLPLAQILDLDEVKFPEVKADYGTIVQNLRMIKKPGENRWAQQNRRWSELALAQDKEGNILFIFTRQPYSGHDFIELLLSSNLGIIAAQHLEGGPEASFYLKTGDMFVHEVGSYETSFYENDNNYESWPIPNVLGIKPR